LQLKLPARSNRGARERPVAAYGVRHNFRGIRF